jgi:signal transduction histidine kinase
MEPLWRSLAVFRFAGLAYVVVAYVLLDEYFERQELGWVVVGLMCAWSVFISAVYAKPAGRTAFFVTLDVLMSCAAVLATSFVDDPVRIDAGEPTLALVWPVAGMLAAAVYAGLSGGTVAAIAVSAASLFSRGEFAWPTVRNVVLLMVTGIVVGYTVDLFRRSQTALVEALKRQAATAERERLSRTVHDGVLQALALVQRQAPALGSAGEDLAQVAGEQEVALRTLISRPLVGLDQSEVDLSAALAACEATSVTVSRPPDAVMVSSHVASELVAAVKAALDNVANHAGDSAHSWILVEAHPTEIIVSIRDDGQGMVTGRIEEAAAAGRLGIKSSIVGRVQDLGGTVAVTSSPGTGTEIEIHVPRIS